MLPAFVLLAAHLSAGQGDTSLPTSIAPGELAACAPVTLIEAENCLRAALSSGDLKIVQDRLSARRFRPDLDMELSAAWRLDDSSSPMGKIMDELLGMHAADIAAGMIISDIQARAAGEPLDFPSIAKMFRENPPANSTPGVPTTYDVPTRKKN